ncbi:MAG: hypothetical protein M1134_05360 [Actinobacteria bacterium]|nr:hypothetical protein [Actinomycetota bacterium]
MKVARVVVLVALVALLPALGTGVLAQFVNGASGGPEQVNTATMLAPSGLVVSNGGCSGTSQQTNTSLSWTDSQSGLFSASGAYLVNGYTALRSGVSSSGPYSSAFTTSGGGGLPPPTSGIDTAPSGASTPTAFGVEGNSPTSGATGSNTVSPVPESLPFTIGTPTAIGTLGDEPNAAQVTPDGSTLVLAESVSNQVQVLNGSGGNWTVVATLAVTRPTAVAIDPAPSSSGFYTAYVVSDRGPRANGDVYPVTIDGAASALGTPVAVGHQADPTAEVVTPNGAYVYVANFYSGTVSAVATAGGGATSIALPGTGPRPIALAVTPDSSHVYVADRRHSFIDDITVASNLVTAHVALTAGALNDTALTGTGDPNVEALSAHGARLFVAEFGVSQVQVVATALAATSPDSVVATIPTGGSTAPIDVAISPNGCLLYVAEWNYNDVFVVNTSTYAISTAYTAGNCGTNDPQPMQVSPDNNYLFLAESYFCGQLDVLDTATNALTTLTNANVQSPTAMVVTPSPYWYEVEGTHFGFISNPSSPAMFSQGWNPGGWQ